MTHPPAAFGPLVSASWLQQNLADVCVFDARRSGGGPGKATNREAFVTAHIPGAVFVDLDQDLSAPAKPRGARRPFPTAAHFAAVLTRAGYDGSTPAVVYDESHGGFAARMWFMLRLLGCPVALLDGGFAHWDGPRESGMPPTQARSGSGFSERPWPAARLVDADTVQRRAEVDSMILDARSHARFLGEPHHLDSRHGHIPAAQSRPWTDNLGPDGRMLPLNQLRERYRDVLAAAAAGNAVTAYCGSGVTACHDLLALECLGLQGDLYVGSWSEWGSDPKRPIGSEASAGSKD